MAKLHPYCIKQAEPITPEILISISNILSFTSHTDLLFWCLFLFAFFLLARKSKLVLTSKEDLIDKQFLL